MTAQRRREVPRHLQPWDYSKGTGVRATPEWQAAHREYIAEPLPGEDGDALYLRRFAAAYDMYVAEVSYEGGTPKSSQELLRNAGRPNLLDLPLPARTPGETAAGQTPVAGGVAPTTAPVARGWAADPSPGSVAPESP
jgi:hypothetical protein